MDNFNDKNRLGVLYEEKPSYDICFHKDFNHLTEELISLDMKGRKFMVVSDSNVSEIYLDEIQGLLAPIGAQVESFVFPAGESSKHLETVNQCYCRLIESGFDRKDVLIALGGGVVGDLTGYVAATYLRGIRFVQIPTTLLSMVDSSIGGKTGVDYLSYKNMIGAFHQPKLVYINLSSLSSLPEREYASGMGEVIKHGLIQDLDYYNWLRKSRDSIIKKEYEILKSMVYRSCEIKKAVVEKDPKELGDRALLNFGHTIGHAVEKLKNFQVYHGECVGIGMAAAAFLSYQRNLISKDELSNILEMIESFGLPIRTEGLDSEEIYRVTRLDKKMDSDIIRFILLKTPGNAYIDTTVSKEDMLAAIHFITAQA